MPTVIQTVENEAQRPIVLDEQLARTTTRNLVGRLEAVALGVQGITIAMTANVDPLVPTWRGLLLGVAVLHLAAAGLALKTGGPFVRGGPFATVWIGLVFVMPLLMASVLTPGTYGANPSCVQLCSYPAAPLVLFAFYPWLGVAYSYLRPGVDITFLATVVLEPLFLIWHINGYVTGTNVLAVAGGATVNGLAYVVGRAIGIMCRTAAQDQLTALRREYHHLFHYLHWSTENSLAAISQFYAGGRKDKVLQSLRELSTSVNRERLKLFLVDDHVSMAHLLNLHARRLPSSFVVRLPRVGGTSTSRSAALLISDALGDLLKNVTDHAQDHDQVVEVTIGFTLEEGMAHLTVKDDGVGFDIRKLDDPTTSLYSLCRLLRSSGGELRVESSPGLGTIAQAWIPLRSS